MKEVRLTKQIEEKDAIIKMLKDKYEEDTGKPIDIVKSKQILNVTHDTLSIDKPKIKQSQDTAPHITFIEALYKLSLPKIPFGQKSKGKDTASRKPKNQNIRDQSKCMTSQIAII